MSLPCNAELNKLSMRVSKAKLNVKSKFDFFCIDLKFKTLDFQNNRV